MQPDGASSPSNQTYRHPAGWYEFTIPVGWRTLEESSTPDVVRLVLPAGAGSASVSVSRSSGGAYPDARLSELRRSLPGMVVLEESASEGCRDGSHYARRDELLARQRPWYRFWERRRPVSMLTTACFTRGPLLAVVAVHLEPERARHYRAAVDALLDSFSLCPDPAPTLERFLARVTALARRRYPDSQIASDRDRFALQVGGARIDLEDAYRTITEGERKEQQVLAELLAALEFLRPSARLSLDEVEDHVLPLIQPHAWVKALDERTPAARRLLRVPFPNDTVVVFVIERGTAVRYVTIEEAERWELPAPLMLEQARANLSRRENEVPIKGVLDAEGSLCALIINAADGFDAARILLPGLRDKIAEHLGPDFVVAIPHRDLLIAFPSDEDDLRRTLHAHIRREARERPHKITDRLFRLDSAWVSSA